MNLVSEIAISTFSVVFFANSLASFSSRTTVLPLVTSTPPALAFSEREFNKLVKVTCLFLRSARVFSAPDTETSNSDSLPGVKTIFVSPSNLTPAFEASSKDLEIRALASETKETNFSIWATCSSTSFLAASTVSCVTVLSKVTLMFDFLASSIAFFNWLFNSAFCLAASLTACSCFARSLLAKSIVSWFTFSVSLVTTDSFFANSLILSYFLLSPSWFVAAFSSEVVDFTSLFSTTVWAFEFVSAVVCFATLLSSTLFATTALSASLTEGCAVTSSAEADWLPKTIAPASAIPQANPHCLVLRKYPRPCKFLSKYFSIGKTPFFHFLKMNTSSSTIIT